MKRRCLVAAGAVLLFSIWPTHSANGQRDEGPRLIAKGREFAIHQYDGFVANNMVESVIRAGIVISHTDLESGEMKWLVSTGTHSIPTRRISYSIVRLVGMVQDDKHLIVVVYSSGRIFTEGDWPPSGPDPKKGQYFLYVFSKKEGKSIYARSFLEPGFLPETVPDETTGSGVIKTTDAGYRVFSRVVRIDESGKVTWEKNDSHQDSPGDSN